MVFPLTFPFTWGDCAAQPKIRVRIAFADDPLDAKSGLTWTDVTADLRAYSFRRGRQNQLNRIEAGTATIVLDNTSGNYFPDNTGGSYSPNVVPMKRINIQASFDGGSNYHDRYTGYITQWVPQWRPGGDDPTCQVEATDGYLVLSLYEINDAGGYAQEASGTRIGNVADDVGWPAADRSIDAGQETVQASGALAAENALSHQQSIQDSEIGILVFDEGGDMVFEGRSHRQSSPHDTAQAIFGDDSGEDEYHDLQLSMDAELLYNEIRFTRAGGSEQAVIYSSSQTAYGKRVLSRSGMKNTTDDAIFYLATMIGARHSVAATRTPSITIKPGVHPSNLLPKVLQFGIGTRITVRKNAAMIDDDFFIEGIDESWSKEAGLTTKWWLSNADQQMGDADPMDVTLVPISDSLANWDASTEGTHYEAVDADDDAKYVTKDDDAETLYDRFGMTAFPYSTGTINSVTMYCRAKQTNANQTGAMEHGLYINSTYYAAEAQYNPTTSWVTKSKEWTTNPDTGVAWTLSDVASLVTYIKGIGPGPAWNTDIYCSRVYLVVNITPQW